MPNREWCYATKQFFCTGWRATTVCQCVFNLVSGQIATEETRLRSPQLLSPIFFAACSVTPSINQLGPINDKCVLPGPSLSNYRTQTHFRTGASIDLCRITAQWRTFAFYAKGTFIRKAQNCLSQENDTEKAIQRQTWQQH